MIFGEVQAMRDRATVATDRLAYRPDEAANLLGLGKSKFYQLLAESDIKTVQVGRATLIPRSELLRFLTENMKGWQDGQQDNV
jgi:excisionase family DNA binding protein